MKKAVILICCISIIILILIGAIVIYNNQNKNENEIDNEIAVQDSNTASINISEIKHYVINDNPDIQYSDAEINFYHKTMNSILEYRQSIDFSDDMKENRWLLVNNPYVKVLLADYEISDNEKTIKFKYNYSEEEHKQICVINGKISKNSDYHIWLSVNLDGLYYYIDSTWDATSDSDINTVSLKYFGLTCDENIERGVFYHELYFDSNSPIVSNNKLRFTDFRNVIDYELIGNHKIKVKRENSEETEIIDLTEV